MKNKARVFVAVVVALAICQILVVLFSWVASVVFPSMEVNSLLGSEGLRWLLSSYERNTNSSLFFYLLFTCFTLGALVSSGVVRKILTLRTCNHEERLGITLFLAILLVGVLLCVCFAFYPRSFLLNVDGNIYPGPYFPAVFIVLALALVLGSFLYVTITAPSHSMSNRLARLFTIGLSLVVPLIVLYFEIMEIVCSIIYMLSPQ